MTSQQNNIALGSLFGRVICLTLALLQLGCSLLEDHFGESCKTHAYVNVDIEAYISSRFKPGSPIRTGIFPFTAPANVSAFNLQRPGLGRDLAAAVHAELLRDEGLPIVELLNRLDWPGKTEEFFTGNFGALSQARNAGYDLLLVGFIDLPRYMGEMTIHTKLIEVESGTTLWYGKSTVHTRRIDMQRVESSLALERRRPDLLFSGEILDEAALCITHELFRSAREIDD